MRPREDAVLSAGESSRGCGLRACAAGRAGGRLAAPVRMFLDGRGFGLLWQTVLYVRGVAAALALAHGQRRRGPQPVDAERGAPAAAAHVPHAAAVAADAALPPVQQAVAPGVVAAAVLAAAAPVPGGLLPVVPAVRAAAAAPVRAGGAPQPQERGRRSLTPMPKGHSQPRDVYIYRRGPRF